MWKWMLIVLAGCQQPRTELMIGVATDLKAPMVLDSAQLIVTKTKDGVVQQMVSWDISGVPNEPFNLPGSYGVYSNGEEVQLGIELQGLKAGRAVVSRHAVLNLIEGKTLFFRMGLTAGCVDNTSCAPTQSCIEGVCSERAIDSRMLPDFVPELTTTLTCQSGATYIDTSTNAPMRFSEDAGMCPAGLCAEGTCLKPPTDSGDQPGFPDGGVSNLPLHRYVVDRQTLPTNNTEARNLGLDLNGDMTVDNQMGMVLGTFAGMGIDPVAAITIAVDRGTTIDLVELGANSFTNGPGSVRLFPGVNPQPPPCNGGTDMVCRRHLMGTGSFGIASDAPLTPPLPAQIVNGTFTTTIPDGALTLTTVLMAPMQLDLFAARVKITSVAPNGLMQGIVAGAIPQADVQNKILPAWAQQYNAQMQADCSTGVPPSCGCQSGSTGATLRDLLDTTNDCVITTVELQNNSLIQSLIAPDINVNGQVGLSLGIGFSAVPAQF